MVENYENKNFNGKETPEQTHTNQFSTNKEAQVKGETVYDDKVIDPFLVHQRKILQVPARTGPQVG